MCIHLICLLRVNPITRVLVYSMRFFLRENNSENVVLEQHASFDATDIDHRCCFLYFSTKGVSLNAYYSLTLLDNNHLQP